MIQISKGIKRYLSTFHFYPAVLFLPPCVARGTKICNNFNGLHVTGPRPLSYLRYSKGITVGLEGDTSPYPYHTEGKGCVATEGVGNLLDKISNKFAISCKESRIETNTTFYSCFYLGPFEQGESVTIANALRRTLLSDLMGVAITSVEIEGAMHEYSSITGVRESVLDILLNLKEIILKQTTLSSDITFTASPFGRRGDTKEPTKAESNYLERKKKGWGHQVGYLRARGPGVIKASDLKLPPYIVCVDPEQYIATLSDDGVFNMKFYISEGKNYLIQIPNKNVQIKRRHLLQQKKRKQAVPQIPTVPGVGVSFVRFLPPPAESLKKRFFNLRKVFNDASTGNPLPIDAVFMPVTKVNYIIEPDEQSNDEQSELEEQSNGDNDTVSKAVGVPVEVQKSGVNLKKPGDKEQRASSTLLVNPLFKNQPLLAALFVKHPDTSKAASEIRKPSNNFTFLHPAPFLSHKHQQYENETFEAQSQQVFQDINKQLLVFDKSQSRTWPGKKKVEQQVFIKKDSLKFKIILEIWTNGSIHPRKALYDSFKSMITLFSRLQKVRILGSMLKSEKFYNKLIELKFKAKNVPSARTASDSPLEDLLLTREDISRQGLHPSTHDPSGPHATEGKHKESPEGVVRKAEVKIKNNFRDLGTLEAGQGKSRKTKGLYSLNKRAASPSPYATLTDGDVSVKKNGSTIKLDLVPIESLNLSLRSYTCLKRSNINTINDLMGYSKKQLIQIKNFSIHSLDEIKTRLGVFSLQLK